MKKNVILILTFVLLSHFNFGQSHARLRISVSEEINIKDSISLTVWKHYAHLGSRFESEEYKIIPHIGKPFELLINDPNDHMRLRLVNSNVGLLLPFVLVESGDSVSMIINKITDSNVEIYFSGPGSAKYRFYEEFKEGKKELNNFWQYIRNTDYPENVLNDIELLHKKWLFNLENYKDNISCRAYKIIKADITGYFEWYKLWMIAVGYGESSDQIKTRFEKILRTLINIEHIGSLDDEVLASSMDYVEYLYNKEKISALFKYNQAFREVDLSNNSPYPFSVLYDRLRDGYHGTLRDQLIIYSLMHIRDHVWFFQGAESIRLRSLMEDAVEIVGSEAIMRLLNKELGVLSGSMAAFNFELPDPDGVNVRLSDLKGRIVLLDFWGYGCSGCLSFKRRFEADVYPELMDNSDFVFVSINVDRKRDTWLDALHLYSNPAFVNLGLHDLGNRHPVFKHYNVKGLPFHVLIDRDGKIITTLLPTDTDRLLNLIQEHLHKQIILSN